MYREVVKTLVFCIGTLPGETAPEPSERPDQAT